MVVTFGRACIVPNRVLPACVNQHVSIIRPDSRYCDPGYLLSVLTHPLVKDYIESFNSGGSRRAITKGHIDSFQIPLPPLAEQKAIATVLGALDDKIENNRMLNHHLAAISVTDSSPDIRRGRRVSRRVARVRDWWRLARIWRKRGGDLLVECLLYFLRHKQYRSRLESTRGNGVEDRAMPT